MHGGFNVAEAGDDAKRKQQNNNEKNDGIYEERKNLCDEINSAVAGDTGILHKLNKVYRPGCHGHPAYKRNTKGNYKNTDHFNRKLVLFADCSSIGVENRRFKELIGIHNKRKKNDRNERFFAVAGEFLSYPVRECSGCAGVKQNLSYNAYKKSEENYPHITGGTAGICNEVIEKNGQVPALFLNCVNSKSGNNAAYAGFKCAFGFHNHYERDKDRNKT